MAAPQHRVTKTTIEYVRGDESIIYSIESKVKGSRKFYYPTISGKRFNKINFARKWEAEKLVKDSIKKYGIKKLKSFFK